MAHTGDEILWPGGIQLLSRPWRTAIISVYPGADTDRARRFEKVCAKLGAKGFRADLGAESEPDRAELAQAIMAQMPRPDWDLVITHGLQGEFSRDRRHESVSQAVTSLWETGVLAASGLWMFAYEDGDRSHLPQPRNDAHFRLRLPPTVWRDKQRLLTRDYGFAKDSWEVQVAPREEAFMCFDSPAGLPKAALRRAA